MSIYRLNITLLCLFTFFTFCTGSNKVPVPGSYRYEEYRTLLEGKSVIVVANQTSMVKDMHLVDFLLSKKINIKAIMAPEHGFRNMADAGEAIRDGMDKNTGLPVISLYGKHFKPYAEDLKGVDVVVFDIQDTGVRFYTYISTLHYVMEACAENNVKCVILDRPNPNGFYYDGNILDTAYRSFVGLHPVPVVHGMTIGEYGNMINGEGWLKNGIRCDLTVIKCLHYTHNTLYELPVKPSPNLPNQNSIYLYPSLCWFEGTRISLGRGTDAPFQMYGAPELPDEGFSFIPESRPGAKNPPLQNKTCHGVDLRNAMKENIVPQPFINLEWLIDAYGKYPCKDRFFTTYFDKLAGGPTLRQQIQQGLNARQIRDSWKPGLLKFAKTRRKYLLYK